MGRLLRMGLVSFVGLSVLLVGCSSSVQMEHVHGLGYTKDGKLMVPSHDGLRTYQDGQWQNPGVPPMDYMGFTITDDGFYSSGHPGPGMNQVNPLGLVKSTDGGKTLIKLGLEGQADFHVMGVGYNDHAIYVLNLIRSANLPTGVEFSGDDGKTWRRSAMQGVQGDLVQMAVHPTQEGTVAVATQSGLYLSADHGDSFVRIGDAQPVSAAAFSPDGQTLYFGLDRINAFDMATKQVRSLQTPMVGAKDAIGYITANPTAPNELAFATYQRDLYRSGDAGRSWQRIAEQGMGLNAK